MIQNEYLGEVYLTTQELSKIIHKTPHAISQWRHRNQEIPYTKIGKTPYYKLSDIKYYLENSRLDHTEKTAMV